VNQHARNIAGNAAFAAAIMLVFGWLMGGLVTSRTEAMYVLAVEAFNWMLRIGGIAMLLVAALCYAGKTAGLVLDFVVSGFCGAIMLACGGYWLVLDIRAGGGSGLQDVFVVLFGFLFVRAAMQSWGRLGGEGSAAPPEEGKPHPASIHPESLPREGEAAPPEGFLAALSREKDRPPGTSDG